MNEESLALADIYSILLREPYSLSMDDIRHATDRQITELFFRPEISKKETGSTVPERWKKIFYDSYDRAISQWWASTKS